MFGPEFYMVRAVSSGSNVLRVMLLGIGVLRTFMGEGCHRSRESCHGGQLIVGGSKAPHGRCQGIGFLVPDLCRFRGNSVELFIGYAMSDLVNVLIKMSSLIN